MKITHDLLKKMNACSKGLIFFDKKYPDGVEAVKGIREFLKLNQFDYCNWFLSHVLSRKNSLRYACNAAWQVLDIFEKQYPGDKRPRAAIEAAERCIVDVSQPAAAAATDAAYAAAYAADAAAATYAADAAHAATYAAAVAADAAADAAAAAVDKKKFIKYGIQLLKVEGRKKQ